MNETALLAAAALALVYALFSRKLETSILTGPMLFLLLGWGLAEGTTAHLAVMEDALHVLAEVTLVIVLFADATRVKAADLLRQNAWPVRMLVIGLPLSVAIGTAAGWIALGGWPFWEIVLLAAILAPTDAALGQAVVTNPLVPERVRRALTVESGLNDGLALPAVLFFGCVAVGGVHDFQEIGWLRFAAEQIGYGAALGLVMGFGGGWLMAQAEARGYSLAPMQGVAILALAGLIFITSEMVGGNGFLAVFVGGVAYSAAQPRPVTYLEEFMETEGTLLVLLTFLLVGYLLVPDAVAAATPGAVAVVVLSLFVVRPLAMWLALGGTDAAPLTRAFIGWFGPRGLAIVLFALLIVMELQNLTHEHEILNIAALAVLVSSVLHGITAAPAAQSLGQRMAAEQSVAATK